MNQNEMDQWPHIVDEYMKKVNNNSETCEIDKNICLFKRQTAGLIVMIYSCGIVLNYDEMIRSESLSSVSNLLIKSNKLSGNDLKFAIYDNGCHLGASVEAKEEQNEYISNIKFVIDRFHQYNHKRPICKSKYSCDLYTELDDINSEICEQKFSHLRRFKTITKHMSRFHFEFFYLCLFSKMNSKSKFWYKTKKNKS